MDKREQIQLSAVKEIKRADYNGIIDISPRVGKSKILIDSIRDFQGNVIISAPYTSIQDSWEAEFEKWNLDNKPGTICSRSLSKIPEGLDLLVVDEVQTLSDNQIEIILKKSPKRILGLSGTISFETGFELSTLLGLKTIFQYSIEDAIKDSIIANFKVYLIGCKLDNKIKNIDSGTKKKSFKTTEQLHYDYLTNQFEKFKKLSWKDRSFIPLKELYMRKRMSFIYESESKLKVAKRLVEKLGRCIVFTGRKEQAQFLCEHTFHTSNKKENNLEKFREKEIDKLGVIEMVNMGITIPDLKHAVIHQIKSNSEMSLQKILRTCNIEDNKEAVIFVTYYENTVDERWVEEAFSAIEKRDRIVKVNEESFFKNFL